MDHPNIVKLYEIFEDENSIQLIIEMMSGGEVSVSHNFILIAL
jgi:serine/threonine protein kinase